MDFSYLFPNPLRATDTREKVNAPKMKSFPEDQSSSSDGAENINDSLSGEVHSDDEDFRKQDGRK